MTQETNDNHSKMDKGTSQLSSLREKIGMFLVHLGNLHHIRPKHNLLLSLSGS